MDEWRCQTIRQTGRNDDPESGDSARGPIDKDNIRTIIDEMTKRIVENFSPIRVILFGSQARGDADRGSDIDMLVIMENGVDKADTAVAIRRKVKDLPRGKTLSSQLQTTLNGVATSAAMRYITLYARVS